MNSNYLKLVESYNMAVEKGYNKFFEVGTEDEILSHDESMTKVYIEEAVKEWEISSLMDLEGKSPEDFVSSIDGFQDIIELYKLAAIKCDDCVPKLILSRLNEFGEIAVKEVVKYAFNNDLADDDQYYIAMASMKLLGFWKITETIDTLVILISDGSDTDEGILDVAKETLVDMGEPAIDAVLDELEKNVDDINNEREYLLEVLIDIPETRANDRVYRCLKNSFLSMENKVVGAIILGQYGDSRAIPVLRGYAEKNLSTIDRETFYEIKFAVESLKGNMDDVKFE